MTTELARLKYSRRVDIAMSTAASGGTTEYQGATPGLTIEEAYASEHALTKTPIAIALVRIL